MGRNQYVEFALACGSAVASNSERQALFAVVTACAGAFAASCGRECDGECSGGEGSGVAAGCGAARVGDVGAAISKFFGQFGGCGSQCRQQDGGSSSIAVECGGGDTVSDGSTVVDAGAVDLSAVDRGKHYLKNKAKREKRKRMAGNWRNVDARSVATVCTVDTRTAVEVEAAQTLAARRVAENKVAEALAEHKLRALRDKSRTVMVDRLAAARGEQRINDAKARSQASFKKCDQSLKSLGSSGSAGEFALKQEVKKAKDNEALRLYVEKQAQMFAKYATPDVLQMVAAIPAPVLQDEFEAFGECPSEYGEDEQEAYFDELNRRNEENFDRCATYC